MGGGGGGGDGGMEPSLHGFETDFGDPGGLVSMERSKTLAKAVTTATLPLAGILLSGSGAIDAAQGDPNAAATLSGSDGGGPADFPARVAPVRRGVVAPGTPSVIPAAIPETITEIKKADLQKKRIGRAETILTSRGALSEPATYRPTLLGQ